jgi:hypothetical protein
VLEWADFIWLGLHGVPPSPDFLFGDQIVAKPFSIRVEALGVEGLADLNLRDKVVYAATCYMPDTNFPEAFKTAGAVVIGGPGENYGSRKRIVGVDKLGRELLAKFTLYPDVTQIAEILTEAKTVLTKGKADADAKEFEVL